MYLHSSRRQTSLLRYTRKGYAYIGVSQSLEVVASILVGDYLSVNLIRILNTQFLSRNVMQKQLFTSSFRHYNMDNNHYAIAKVQKVFGFTSGKGEKFGLGHKKALIHYCIRAGWRFCYMFCSCYRHAAPDSHTRKVGVDSA